jgi:hypothetical protein
MVGGWPQRQYYRGNEDSPVPRTDREIHSVITDRPMARFLNSLSLQEIFFKLRLSVILVFGAVYIVHDYSPVVSRASYSQSNK